MKDYALQVIAALGPVIGALCLYVLRRLAHSMNSKMDRLLELTAKAAHAEGVLEEKTRRSAEDRALRGER